jgi:subtilase family serine protease
MDMSGNQGSTSMRNIPDVALVADNCWVYADGQSLPDQEGTSFAAPLWAGFTALANEQAAVNGEAPIGFINPAIYSLGRTGQLSSNIRDVTSGDNTWTGSPNKFYAETGYDLCTGWGSPKGQSTINDLTEAQLFALAYQNKSEYIGATSHNNNRNI